MNDRSRNKHSERPSPPSSAGRNSTAGKNNIAAKNSATRGDATKGSSPAKQRLLIVDICDGAIAYTLHQLSANSVDELCARFPLALPPSHSDAAIAIAEHERASREQFSDFLQSLKDPHSLTILLGCLEDPFYPFEGKFDQALKVLERVAAIQPRQVVVQTRSPLAVLAMPIFRALGERLSVRVAFDATSDILQGTYLPQTPRTSERITFARALHSLGIRTTLQLSPIVGRGSRTETSREFQTLIAESDIPIQLVPLGELLHFSQRKTLGRDNPGAEPIRVVVARSDAYAQKLAKLYGSRIENPLPAHRHSRENIAA